MLFSFVLKTTMAGLLSEDRRSRGTLINELPVTGVCNPM